MNHKSKDIRYIWVIVRKYIAYVKDRDYIYNLGVVGQCKGVSV